MTSFKPGSSYFVLLLIIMMSTTTTEGMRTVLSGNRLPDIVPGRPGEDYPALSSIPVTQFRCTDQIHSGYFADLETSCQVFRVCQQQKMTSFLCPNGTLFNQRFFVCDWWFNVNCSTSPDYFFLNEKLQRPPQKGTKPGERPAVLKALNDITPAPSFARFDKHYVDQQSEPSFAEWTSRHIPGTRTEEPARFRGILSEEESNTKAPYRSNTLGYDPTTSFPFREEFLPSTSFPDSPFIRSSRPNKNPNKLKSSMPQSTTPYYSTSTPATPSYTTSRPLGTTPNSGAAPVDNWFLLAKDPDMLNNIIGSAVQYSANKNRNKAKNKNKDQYSVTTTTTTEKPSYYDAPVYKETPPKSSFRASELMTSSYDDFQPKPAAEVVTRRPDPPASPPSYYSSPKPTYTPPSSSSRPSINQPLFTDYQRPPAQVPRPILAAKPTQSAYPYSPPGVTYQVYLTKPPGDYEVILPGSNSIKSTYGPPPSTYGPPKSTYGAPQSTYGPPKSTYGPPQSTYGPPPSTYGPPQATYGPPQSSYSFTGTRQSQTPSRPIYQPQDSSSSASSNFRQNSNNPFIIFPSQLPLEPHPQIPITPQASTASFQQVSFPSSVRKEGEQQQQSYQNKPSIERFTSGSVPMRPSTLISVSGPSGTFRSSFFRR